MSAHPNALDGNSGSALWAEPASVPRLPGSSVVIQIRPSVRRQEDLLQQVVARAVVASGADGAALALRDARRRIVCRARAGEVAPDIGALVNPGDGFSGECARAGRPLLCRDAEHDPRVDPSARHQLGVRSLAVVPITQGRDVMGILEVLSDVPDAFHTDHLLALGELAQWVAAAVATGPEAAAPAAPWPASTVPEVERRVRSRPGLRQAIAVACCVLFVFSTIWGLPYWRVTDGLRVPARSELSMRIAAAETGEADAQFAVGTAYARGEQGRPNYTQAVRWFQRAADQGHILAQRALGSMYWAGRGLPKDLVSAYVWSAIAAAAGDSASQDRVRALAPFLTKSELAEAESRATAWLRSHPSHSLTPKTSASSAAPALDTQ